MLVIALAAAVIGGATMAWFTDEKTAEPVTFTAGTLLIDIDKFKRVDSEVNIENLNPGDEFEYEFDVVNVGTKQFIFIGALSYKDIIGQANGELGYDMIALLDSKGYGTDPLSEALNFKLEVTKGPWIGTVYEGLLANYDNTSHPLYPPNVWPDLIWPGTGYNNEPHADIQYPVLFFGEAGPVAAGDKVSFKATFSLPKDADNKFQGSKLKGAFTVLARQIHEEAIYGALELPLLTNYPSTNLLNQQGNNPRRTGTQGPHVNKVSADAGSVTLEFVNPFAYWAAFEIRIDDSGPGTTSHWGNMYPWIDADEYAYQSFSFQGNESKTDTFQAQNKVEVRLAGGCESDWYFDWVTFYVE